jgi:hypothetical protein
MNKVGSCQLNMEVNQDNQKNSTKGYVEYKQGLWKVECLKRSKEWYYRCIFLVKNPKYYHKWLRWLRLVDQKIKYG